MSFLWGSDKDRDDKNKRDKQHSPNRHGDERYNTRSSDRKQSPTRQPQQYGSSSRLQTESSPMDCDDSYTTSNSVYGGQRNGHLHGGGQWQRHDGYPDIHHHGDGIQPGYGMGQQQSQGHIFRSAQASKQMVYEVYGNCLTMLEELESRELQRLKHQPLPRSDIYLPDQRKHDVSTVQRKLETQLLLFQSQLTSCDKEIKEETQQELKEHTLVWNSQREKNKVPDGLTDKYAGKLFEVLEKGKTEHPKEFYERPEIDEAGMRNAMEGIMQGNQRRAQLDDDFKKDSKKKATAPKVRQGAGKGEGADRLARNNPHLERDVDRYRDNNTSLL